MKHRYVKSCNEHAGKYTAGCPGCQARARREYKLRKLRELQGLPPGFLDPTGTRRRIQALFAIGWDYQQLAARLGRTAESLRQNANNPTVHRRTADAIRRLYDELSMTPGPSDRARRLAERRGWSSPLAWNEDEIDDPDARPRGVVKLERRNRSEVDPVTVQRVLDGDDDGLFTTTAERHLIMRAWLDRGGSEKALCDRLGWKQGRYGREQVAA